MRLNKFTFGVSLGLVIGLLVAPSKGADTRKKLADTAANLRFRINELLGKEDTDFDELKLLVADEGAELSHEARLKLLKVIEKAKKSYEDLKQELS